MEAYKSLLEMGLWVIVATMGWFLRELWGAVKELRSDLHRLEVNLPTNFSSTASVRAAERASSAASNLSTVDIN